MNEADLISRYNADAPIYENWGSYVNHEITNSLKSKTSDVSELDLFLKIPPKPRVKNINSIVSKAFYRNKNYSNPYEEITDKVGVRYVVLLKKDIDIIRTIVEDGSNWAYSTDRDFEKEKLENPTTFDYQSVHYIVRCKKDTQFNNVEIPTNTPCEIQIRTLLQHAYSELTHDTIYKPKTKATPEVHRLIAKSMALIEVTDDIFGQATMTLKSSQNNFASFLILLKKLYENIAESDYEEKVNIFILDAFRELLNSVSAEDIKEFLKNKVIAEIITRKYSTSLIYRQPIILFIYYLISKQRNNCKQYWPLSDKELRPLFSDLGISFDSAY